MIFKNNSVSVRIVKRLGVSRFYLGDFAVWRWKRLLLPRRYEFGKGMNPHMAIVGESGGGKSNSCRLLLKELSAKGFNLIVLDPNGDYIGIADSVNAEVYDAARCGMNIFELDNMGEAERISEIMAIFTKRLRLGHVQSSLLKRCISYSYWINKAKERVPTIRDLLFTIKRFEARATGGELRTLSVLHERVSLLNTSPFSRSIDLKKVMNGRSIFLLSSLHTHEAQAVYMESLLRKIYSMMLGEGYQRRPTYVVIDEARKISESSVLGRLVAEGRKYGIGVITISQRSSEIDSAVLGNSSVVVSFYQREPSELNYISNYISGGTESNRLSEIRRAIRNLGVGEAIILDHRLREPIIGRFGLVPTARVCLKHFIESSAMNGIEKEALMESLAKVCGDSKRIDRSVLELKAEKILHEYDRWYISNPRNSAEHDIYVNLLSKKLKKDGVSNDIYNSAYGPDIIAYRKGRRIAVEYETGKKNLEDVRHMLDYRKKGYGSVVVVVNDLHYAPYSKLEGVIVTKASEFLASPGSSAYVGEP